MMDPMTSTRRAELSDIDACVAVLARLPDHFTPDTHHEVREAMALHPAWVATSDDGAIVGFVLVEHRYPTTAEITFAAVDPELHGSGIGTQVLDHALRDLAHDGVVAVEAKTLDASAGYEPYVATRAFWEARGFVQIDCIDPLPGWQPGNPSAIYVAALRPTR
jgi:ribosomal protein S18 acetylase RimI-like enzyme